MKFDGNQSGGICSFPSDKQASKRMEKRDEANSTFSQLL
jgi:hypothetical protein